MKFLFLAFLAKLGGLAMLGLPFYTVWGREVCPPLGPQAPANAHPAVFSH